MKTTQRLYNFTSDEYALANIENRHLKISFPNEVNDLFELKPFDFGERGNRQKWQNSIDRQAEKQGFVSLAKQWSTPTMWAHYANNHQGICYGFDVHCEDAVEINYVDKLRRFDTQALTCDRILGTEMDYATITKSSHWNYEEEFRLYIRLDEDQIRSKKNGQRLFFIKFNKRLVLKEVILGARSKISSDCIKNALHPFDNVTIRTARPSFREYKIVEQKNPSLKK